MKHSLINPNQVRFHGIDLFDNPVCDEELFIELDYETAIPLKFKGTKCVLKSWVPTRLELESCTHYDMKNDTEWNPQSVDLQSPHNIYEVKKESRAVYKVKRDMVHALPSSNHIHDIFEYSYPS